MGNKAVFQKAFPYRDDILALPVADVDSAARWYAQHFAMIEVERKTTPHPTVIMTRDDIRIGFSRNGGDSSQEGAAILVSDIRAARAELQGTGVKVGEESTEERDGVKFLVFFVVAPDGLCYYFHQPAAE